MRGARILEVTAELAASRARLLDSAAPLSDADFSFSPQADRWSIGEILHHLMLTEGGVVRVLQKLADKAEKAGLGPDPGTSSILHSLDRLHIETVVEKIVAGASVVPTKGAPARELREGLAGSRAALMKALELCERFDMTQMQFPHPVFGMLDAYQWVLFVAQHEERHRRQIESVKALLGGRS
jgi:hypothetical protein